MHKPKLLILDEPINGLDPMGIREMRELFLTLAHDRGMTILLSSHILSEIEHTADTIGVISIAVNLSRAHLSDANFLARYIELKKAYRIPDRLIEIELTESLVFENLEVLIEVIDEIRAAGFRCALDDFGSGYSSLNVLKDIHVDTLKLDGAFWRSPSGDNERQRDIIAIVIELAKKLHMATVSEGVETKEQLAFLQSLQCDMVQGYIYSKPIPCSEFESGLLLHPEAHPH